MAIARIRKNDTVIVISGTSAGKAVRRTEKTAGGIIDIEMPIRLSKLMPYDAEAKRGTRVKTGEKDGKKARVSVKSGKTL